MKQNLLHFFLLIILLIYKINQKDKQTDGSIIQPNPLNLERESASTKLPDSLGGSNAHGFAVVTMTYDKSFHLTLISLRKLHVIGARVVDYWYPHKITREVVKYLPFLKEYALKQKITINKDANLPDVQNELSFIVRF